MPTENEIEEFWAWFAENSALFLDQAGGEVVDVVCGRLQAIDEQLSVEVSGLLPDGSRELVVTSHGDSSRFELINDIVRGAPELSRWRLFSLKPPRGFDFARDHLNLEIGEWNFLPLKNDSEFTELGVRIEMSQNDYHQVDGVIVSSILEEGVGEVLLSVCSHLEYSVAQTPNAMPIDQLSEVLHAWAMTRGPESIRAYLPRIDY